MVRSPHIVLQRLLAFSAVRGVFVLEQNQGTDRVKFELQERIPLEELTRNISVIRNVEVKPEIEMIAEYSTYRIRGALVFTGEYEARKSGETNHPLILDRSANYNKRLVRQIHHHIPVDITLPAERIDENGVVMEITSLDYDLAEPNQLVVTTEIELQGVRPEEAERPQSSHSDEEIVKTIYFDEAKDPFSHSRGLDEAVEPVNHTIFENDHSHQQTQQEETLFTHDERENVHNIEEPLYRTDDQQDVEIRVEVENREETVAEEQRDDESTHYEEFRQEEAVEEQEELGIRPTIEDVDTEVKVTISNKNANSERFNHEESVSPAVNERNDESSQGKALSFLSDILKNREETMTQIQICLVQPGETIQDIAYRYKIDEGEILRANNISVTSNISGRVLKIPVRKAR